MQFGFSPAQGREFGWTVDDKVREIRMRWYGRTCDEAGGSKPGEESDECGD